MKRIAIFIAVLLFTAACSEEDPSIRVRNDLAVKVNMQLQPAVGNTININDVAGGSMSSDVTVQEGRWTANASIQSQSASPETVFDVKNDYRYTVVVVNVDPPVLQVQSEEK